MAEQCDELIAQFDFADEEEQQRGEEQDKFAGGRGEERYHRDHHRGGRHVHIEPGFVAEQRAFQLVQSRHWLVEHREFVLDSGDDLRPPRNPLADRARQRHRGKAYPAETEQQNDDCGKPGRNAETFGRLYDRRQREREHRRGEDGQQYGPADIKKRAEQQQENADNGAVAGRDPNVAFAVERPGIADNKGVADFAVGPDVVHETLHLPPGLPPDLADLLPT